MNPSNPTNPSNLPPPIPEGFQPEESIHLSEYYRLLLRHKWLIISSVGILFALAMLHNSRLQPIYRATATMIIDRESNKSPLTGRRTDYENYMSESLTFNTHFKLITSRPVIEMVLRDLEMDREGGGREMFRGKIKPPNPVLLWYSRAKGNLARLLNLRTPPAAPADPKTAMVRAVRSTIGIQPIEDTRLLKIHVTALSPRFAEKAANSLAENYIRFNTSNRMQSSQSTLQWLSEQLYEMKKKLEDAEQEFLEFKQQARLISLEDRRRVIAKKINDFNNEYLDARNQRLELETRLEQLNRMTESRGGIRQVRSLIDNQLINDLYGRLVNAEVERERLVKVFKSKHPKIVQIDSEIDQTRRKLLFEINREVDNLKARREVLNSKEAVLQQTIADFEKEGMETNEKALQSGILERNVQMNQNLYNTLLQRLKEADITGNIDVSNIRVTEKAVVPRFPVGPNKKRNLMLALVFGLMLGVGISFLIEYLDRTLRTEEDVRRHLGLPVLAVIPLAEKAQGRTYYGRTSRSKAEKD